MTRVAIFIDGSNVHHLFERYCTENDFDGEIDYHYIQQDLLDGRHHAGTHYYGSITKPNRRGGNKFAAEVFKAYKEQERFYDDLRKLGFVLHIERLNTASKAGYRCPKCGHRGQISVGPRERQVDSSLIMDMLRMGAYRKYDVAVLVSGDGDFAWAVSVVKSMGLKVEWATFTRYGVSKKLKEVCGEPIRMGPIIEGTRAW